MLGKIWDIIKAIAAWSWKNKQTALIIGLILTLMIISKLNNDKNLELKNELATATGKTIILKDNLKAQIVVGNRELTFIYKDADGKIQKIVREIPREGRIEIELADGKLKKNLLQNPLTTGLDSIKDIFTGGKIEFGEGDGTVKVIDRGFTHKLGFGMWYDGNYDGKIISPALDLKLLYFKRYGFGLGSSINAPFVFLSRYADDFTFGIFENVEMGLGYGKPYSNFQDSLFMLGMRMNL